MLRLLPKNESKRIDDGFITDPVEINDAQQRLFHLVQLESFNTEKKCLLKSSPLNKSSKLVEFSSSLDLTVYCSVWSHKTAGCCFVDLKHPILLDSRLALVRLFLENFHTNQCHQGAVYFRVLIQQEYTIVTLRPTL